MRVCVTKQWTHRKPAVWFDKKANSWEIRVSEQNPEKEFFDKTSTRVDSLWNSWKVFGPLETRIEPTPKSSINLSFRIAIKAWGEICKRFSFLQRISVHWGKKIQFNKWYVPLNRWRMACKCEPINPMGTYVHYLRLFVTVL